MLDHWLSHSKFRQAYENLVQKMLKDKISANQLTIIGLVVGLASASCIFLSGMLLDLFFYFYLTSSILMVISFILDTFDGAIARMVEPTKFGGILDIFCDRLVEVSIIIAVVSTDPFNLLYPGLFSLGAMVLCISMFLLSGIILDRQSQTTSLKIITYKKGIIERSETFLWLLFINIFYTLRFILLWLFAVLVFITAIQRLIQTSKNIDK